MTYQPPYLITSSILTLVAEISETLGRNHSFFEKKSLSLRRINQIKTLKGTLAIEGNKLSEKEISTILEGKMVVAPPREIQEVLNAIKAYDHLFTWDPTSEKDLLAAHKMLMLGLLDAPGNYRKSNVGVMKHEEAIHVAPSATRLSILMHNLFTWLRQTNAHPLIASTVFHYEFEFILPFEDGNGRIGRLWQTLILSTWKPFFYRLPVENMIHQQQKRYYEVLHLCNQNGTSTLFIEFMLSIILETIQITVQQKKN